MRKLSLIGGLVLALTVGTATMAATPTTVRSAATTPTTAVTILSWRANFAKAPIAGAAVLTGTSTYSVDRVVVRASGVKKGAVVTLQLLEKVGTKVMVVSHITVSATLTKTNTFLRTWYLSAAARSSLKYAVAHNYPLYVRVIDGATVATGHLYKI